MSGVVVSLFKSVTQTRVAEEIGWTELVQTLRSPPTKEKAQQPLLKLALFNGERGDSNVMAVTGVECDYDGELIAFEAASTKLAKLGIECFIHTTASHTPEAPRFRILVPFSIPYTRNNYDLAEVRSTAIHWIEEQMGIAFSNESFVLSQSSFYGVVPGRESYAFHYIEGKYLDTMVNLGVPSAQPDPQGMMPDYIPGPVVQTYNSLVDLREELVAYGYEEVAGSDRLVGPLSQSREPGVTIYPPSPGRPYETATAFHEHDPLHFTDSHGVERRTMDAFTMLLHWKCGGDTVEAFKRAEAFIDDESGPIDLEAADEGKGVLPLSDFLALDFPPIVYRVEPFIPDNCLGMVHAKPGVGKTWLMMDLIVALKLGRPWLGTYDIATPLAEDEKALLIDTEMPEQLLYARWKQFLAPLEPAERDLVARNTILMSTLRLARLNPDEEPFDLAKPRWQKGLMTLCTNQAVRLMVTDNKSSAMPSEEEENSNDGVAKQVTQWLGHVRNAGISTWLVGHSGHSGEHLRGGSHWGGPMDTIIHLNESGKSQGRVDFEMKIKKTRHGMPLTSDPKVSLIDVAPGQVALVPKTSGEGDLGPTELKLISWLAEHPGGSQRQAGDALALSQSRIKGLKATLVEKGMLAADSKMVLTQAGEDLVEAGDIDLDEI